VRVPACTSGEGGVVVAVAVAKAIMVAKCEWGLGCSGPVTLVRLCG
jgi:hypothetical protein